MKNLLITIFVLSAICAVTQADPTITGTLYNSTTTGMKAMTSNQGLARQGYKVSMTPNYDILIDFMTGSSAKNVVSRNSGWSGTFTIDTILAGSGGGYTTTGWYQDTDTSILLLATNLGTAGDTMRNFRYTRTTQGAVDTVDGTRGSSSGGRPAMTKIGTSSPSLPLYVNVIEDADGDSVETWIGNGTTAPVTWTKKYQKLDGLPPWRLCLRPYFTWNANVGGGNAWWNYTNDMLLWNDSATVDTLSSDFWPGNTGNNNGVDMTHMIPVRDSHWVAAMQINTTAGQDSLVVKSGYVTGVGAGSGTLGGVAQVKVINHDIIKTGHNCYPVLSRLYGTDTVILLARTWPDTTRAVGDSVNLHIWISGNGGTTWAGPYLLLAAAVNRKCVDLQAPVTVYRNGNDIYYPVTWRDSVSGAASDSGSVYKATITTATAIDTLETFLQDSLPHDFSGESDSVQFRMMTGAQIGNDSVIIAWSTSASPDSSAGANRYAYAYTASHTDTIKVTIDLTESGTIYGSAWVRDGTNWSARKVISRSYVAAVVQSKTFHRRNL